MYNEYSILKISKKQMKEELIDLARQAWNYYLADGEENIEKFRFYFNYFFNNNREVQEVDYMYDEQFSHPHFHYVSVKYPKVASKVDEILKSEGISIIKMKEKFDKIMKEREDNGEKDL